MHDFTADQIKNIIGQIISRGLLRTSVGKYPILSLTPQGIQWLNQRESLALPQITEYAFEKAKKLEPKIRKSLVASDSRYSQTKSMVLRKFTLSEIAKRHGFARETIISHIEKLMVTGETFDISYLMPRDPQFREIKQAFEKCGLERLKPVYDFLKEKYSYEKIKLVRLGMKVNVY